MLLECCSKENVECGTEKAASFLAEVVSLLGNFELNNYFPGFQIYIKHFIHILDHKLKCQGYITQHWVSEESKCGLLLVHKQFRVVF